MSEPDDDFEMSREDLVGFISQFMTDSVDVETIYRSHLVESMVSRVYAEFGEEGLCDMMIKIDERAGWVSDILLESPELDNEMFKRHVTYDQDLIYKARHSTQMRELNKKIWRLRRKYSRLIVDEIFENEGEPELELVFELEEDQENGAE
jgi:hypothetical protein